MNNLHYLFQQLKVLEMKFEKLNETSMDKFNIFSILRKSHDEVNLHSRFIFELLNPKGSHQQGSVFFNLFINQLEINFNDNEDINIQNEKDNIDILIKSNTQAIIIENKIYSEDHSKQLSTYFNKIYKSGYKKENIFLIYLTLFGIEPTEDSIKNRVIKVSYERDIVNWLELCLKEVSLIPTLRETINQYLKLVKQLTNQSQYKGHIMEVKDFLLSDKKNLEIALGMNKAIVESKIEVQLLFWKELESRLNQSPYEFKFYSSHNTKTFKSSVRKYYEQQKNKRHYGLKCNLIDNLIFFIEIDYNIYYGFYENVNKNFKKEHLAVIDNVKIDWYKQNKTCYYKYPKKKLDFERFNGKNILNLVDEDSRATDVQAICDEILYVMDEYTKLFKDK